MVSIVWEASYAVNGATSDAGSARCVPIYSWSMSIPQDVATY